MRTARNEIRGNLRRLFLKSRERAEALKRDKYSCQRCGVKQSRKKGFEQKVEVHHKKGIKVWAEIINLIEKELLCDASEMITLCPECHKKEEEN